MEKLVLDASVGAKLIFREEDSERADLLLSRLQKQRIEIMVPEFFYVELANISWVRVRRKSVMIDEVIIALDRISKFPLETYSDRELADLALENSLMYDISVYDGLYVALAEIYAAPLVTADRKLFNALKDRFDFVEFLDDVVLN